MKQNKSQNKITPMFQEFSVTSGNRNFKKDPKSRPPVKEKELKNNLVEEKDKLADIIMEENYKKSLKAKQENKEKEKKNIFKSDLSVYKKIYDKNSGIPDFFMAKYVVLDYLNKNKYLETENPDSSADELFELYTILYSSRFTENYVVPEEFEDVVLDFLESLPDTDIMTSEQIHNKLNKITEYGMFSTDVVRN
jgi:hypothetical protein